MFASEDTPETAEKNQERTSGSHFSSLGGYGGQQAGRQSARGMIASRIARLRREADGLDRLLKSIPEELPPEADEALWSLACKP
jgi:hypothetical protein